jgi:hypothetical protein
MKKKNESAAESIAAAKSKQSQTPGLDDEPGTMDVQRGITGAINEIDSQLAEAQTESQKIILLSIRQWLSPLEGVGPCVRRVPDSKAGDFETFLELEEAVHNAMGLLHLAGMEAQRWIASAHFPGASGSALGISNVCGNAAAKLDECFQSAATEFKREAL